MPCPSWCPCPGTWREGGSESLGNPKERLLAPSLSSPGAEAREGRVALFCKLVQDQGLGHPTRKDSNVDDNGGIGCHLLAICSVAGPVLSTLPV